MWCSDSYEEPTRRELVQTIASKAVEEWLGDYVEGESNPRWASAPECEWVCVTGNNGIENELGENELKALNLEIAHAFAALLDEALESFNFSPQREWGTYA